MSGLFDFQVAGHGKILKEDCYLVKPTKEAEAIFYETVNDRAPELIPFIPVYHGRRTLPSSEDVFIALGDLTLPFRKPCVMDIKMGTVLFNDFVSPQKRVQREQMAAKTTTGSLGIRICGMTVYSSSTAQYEKLGPKLGREYSADTIQNGFAHFFPQNPEYRQFLLRPILDVLDRIGVAVAPLQSKLKLYSTSILVIYEGAVSGPIAAAPPPLVKMIDFAQTQFGGTRDDGYLKGLRSLQDVLQQLLAECSL